MGRFFIAETLLTITSRPAAKVADVPLEPIVPGAWAAWARDAAVDAVATTPVPPTTVAAPKLAPARSHR